MPAVSTGAFTFSQRNAPLMISWQLPALPPRSWPCPSELLPFCLLLGCLFFLGGLERVHQRSEVVMTLVMDLVASMKMYCVSGFFEMLECLKGQANPCERSTPRPFALQRRH